MNPVTKLCEVLSTETRHCEKHGPYESKLIKMLKHAAWSQCEQCVEEKRASDLIESQKRNQAEMRRRSIERRLGNACIPPRFQFKGFDNYVTHNKGQEVALAKCKKYADQFKDNFENGKSLLLLGSVGTGKTHLANAIANQIIKKTTYTALYVTVGAMLRYIRSSYSDKDLSEIDAYRVFTEPHLLIVDEIGVQKASEFELTALFDIINERYEQLFPTIIISNHGPRELADYLGDRVVDRLREGGSMILFEWESARVKSQGIKND